MTLDRCIRNAQARYRDAISPKPKQMTESWSGSGFGPAVVAHIVTDVNGLLRLKSEEGAGSRFVVGFSFGIPVQHRRPALHKTGGTKRYLRSPKTSNAGRDEKERISVIPSQSRIESNGCYTFQEEEHQEF